MVTERQGIVRSSRINLEKTQGDGYTFHIVCYQDEKNHGVSTEANESGI